MGSLLPTCYWYLHLYVYLLLILMVNPNAYLFILLSSVSVAALFLALLISCWLTCFDGLLNCIALPQETLDCKI